MLAVHHGVLPPTLHGDDPHPALADTRFRLLDQAEPWSCPAGPRRSGVNAFGFGGINAHVIVEQHGSASTPARTAELPSATQGLPTRPDDHPFRFDAILLQGGDGSDLADQLAAISPDRHPDRASLPAGSGPARLAIVDPNPKRLELAARVLAKGQPWRGRNDIWFEPSGLVAGGGRVAFLFPGIEPTFEADLGDIAGWFGLESAALPDGAKGIELQGRKIFEAGRLLHQALTALGIAPDDIAGHSLGEWTGAFTAELIPADLADDFLDGLKPGSLEVPGVVFVALGCGASVAGEVIAGLDGVVVSHDNCPHQSVICGPEESMAEAGRRLAARKVLAQELPFRSGFHTPFFEPYLDIVRHHWDRMPLQAARIPLWSATTCERYPDRGRRRPPTGRRPPGQTGAVPRAGREAVRGWRAGVRTAGCRKPGGLCRRHPEGPIAAEHLGGLVQPVWARAAGPGGRRALGGGRRRPPRTTTRPRGWRGVAGQQGRAGLRPDRAAGAGSAPRAAARLGHPGARPGRHGGAGE